MADKLANLGSMKRYPFDQTTKKQPDPQNQQDSIENRHETN